jgi:hypothetical protein
MSIQERFKSQAAHWINSGRAAFYANSSLASLPGKDGGESDLHKVMDEPIKGQVVLVESHVESCNGPVLLLAPLPDEYGEVPNLRVPVKAPSMLKIKLAEQLRKGAVVHLSGNMKEGLVEPTEITVDGATLNFVTDLESFSL